MSTRLSNHYANLLAKFGDTHESAQWSSRDSQELRFKILSQIGDLNNSSVLDFGCGTGHLSSWFLQNGFNVRYTGVDVLEEFFEVGKSKAIPRSRFGYLNQFEGEKFDYIFISGVFNNKRKNNRQFYQETILNLFPRCNKGIAFNMMSTYVDYKNPQLFYESPVRVFNFLKNHITPFVNLRNDYRLKQGVIPFEFCVYAYQSLE